MAKKPSDLVPQAPADLVKYSPTDMRGKESIGAEDRVLPRLSIAQKTNPQLEAESTEYIPGLKLYEMFNSVSGENYHNGPVDVVFVAFRKFAIEFDDANNVVDPNVPLSEEAPGGRLAFGRDANGRPIRPKATLFYEYLAVLPKTGDAVLVTFKGAGIKTAKRKVNAVIIATPGPMWARQFQLSSVRATSGQFTFGAFQVQTGDPTPDALAETCAELYDAWTAGKVKAAAPEGDDATISDDSLPF